MRRCPFTKLNYVAFMVYTNFARGARVNLTGCKRDVWLQIKVMTDNLCSRFSAEQQQEVPSLLTFAAVLGLSDIPFLSARYPAAQQGQQVFWLTGMCLCSAQSLYLLSPLVSFSGHVSTGLLRRSARVLTSVTQLPSRLPR